MVAQTFLAQHFTFTRRGGDVRLETPSRTYDVPLSALLPVAPLPDDEFLPGVQEHIPSPTRSAPLVPTNPFDP
jgi:hypothetical protein